MKLQQLLPVAESFASSTLTVRTPSGTAVTRSYPELVADVRELQKSLVSLGLRAGHIVGLHAAATYEFIVWDLALLDMGIVSQVFPEGHSLSELNHAAEAFNLVCLVSPATETLVLPTAEAPDNVKVRLSPNLNGASSPDPDLLTLVYSSGTTGRTKGLKISRNGVTSLAQEFISSYEVTADDRHLIFLPLSHFQQRLSIYSCLFAGASLMLTPYTHIFQDLPRFAPTFLIGPPALYETLLGVLVPKGREGEARERLTAGLGDKLRFMITGMAPIRRGVLDAFAAHGLTLVEAYGITEVGLVAWNTPRDNQVGTVGRPLGIHEVVLAADKEVIVQTRHALCTGYFESHEDDARLTFLGEGRVATGDVGELVEGRLVLKGRKKDIIVTSGGMKFHPGEIENLLLTCPLVRQAVVLSDDRRKGITAILSVDDSADAKIADDIARCVESVNLSLDSHKRVERTVLTTTRFTVDNELLTRTMKPNRSAISRHFLQSAPA